MADRDAQLCETAELSNLRNTESSIGRDGEIGLGGQCDRKVCGTHLVRAEISGTPNIDTKGSFQFGMDFGRGVVKGHHKEAPLKRPRYAKP